MIENKHPIDKFYETEKSFIKKQSEQHKTLYIVEQWKIAAKEMLLWLSKVENTTTIQPFNSIKKK